MFSYAEKRRRHCLNTLKFFFGGLFAFWIISELCAFVLGKQSQNEKAKNKLITQRGTVEEPEMAILTGVRSFFHTHNNRFNHVLIEYGNSKQGIKVH